MYCGENTNRVREKGHYSQGCECLIQVTREDLSDEDRHLGTKVLGKGKEQRP